MAHFHVSGAGHEATAALASHLTPVDWLHLHYRDKALLLARGIPIIEFFRSSLCRGLSHSSGRQMSAHFSAAHLNITSFVGPVGNNALQAVGVAAAVQNRPGNPIVVCSVGDGTTQQGEFMEAVAEAVRWQLPVLFLIEDNHWSISTPTAGKTLFCLPRRPAQEFLGLTIRRFDGSDVNKFDCQLGAIVQTMRRARQPQLIVMETERLNSHTNADDQTIYRHDKDLKRGRADRDPIQNLRRFLLHSGTSESSLTQLETEVSLDVGTQAEQAKNEEEPSAIFTAKEPYPSAFCDRIEYRGDQSLPRLNVREALNAVLKEQLASDPRVFLYGQDIEDPKGDVFGVTQGLSTAFPERVVNAPLSESTIVGTAIGRALAGQRPVVFIQFADFLPLAFNQIISELGSMAWRTNGQWHCPVILMVTCGGYKPGLGPFHAQTMDGLAAHVPGIDVMMPASAADAAGLLNAAFQSTRPTLFLYPKSCLNTSDRTTSNDISKHFIPPGRSLKIQSGRDLTLVTWGNPVGLCIQVARILAQVDLSIDLFDLRSLSPWDERTVILSAERTGRLVVVHEDNQTCGFGAEILASVSQHAKRHVQMRRVARPDTYIPCNYGNQLEVLPSFQRVLETCADLLNYDVTWALPEPETPGESVIRVVGSGPADDTVRIVDIRVRLGDFVTVGQVVAESEATKSIVDICASASGYVIEINATVGDVLRANEPLIRLRRVDRQAGSIGKPASTSTTNDRPGTPHLTPRATQYRTRLCALPTESDGRSTHSTIDIVDLLAITGSRVVSNLELAKNWPKRSANEIFNLTGIESRRWVDPNFSENVLSLAVRAAEQILSRNRLSIRDIDLVIACTTTPDITTPSLACRIVGANSITERPPTIAAYDINAACSGYLYGLSQAFDYLQQRPSARILLITSEVLSPLLDSQDFETAILFGDAATATLIAGSEEQPHRFRLARPVISGTPDSEHSLSVPLTGHGFLHMYGVSVFRQAVRSMVQVLLQACGESSLALNDLNLVIPHQANQRILDVLETRIGRPVRSALRHTGNTSSSSIPLALQQVTQGRIALIAFGGGYTSAATIGTAAEHHPSPELIRRTRERTGSL